MKESETFPAGEDGVEFLVKKKKFILVKLPLVLLACNREEKL